MIEGHCPSVRRAPQIPQTGRREPTTRLSGPLENKMNPTPKPRGFAAMTPEKRREIATKGGAGVPAEKRAFSRDRELAAEAGRKGGVNKPVRRKGL